MTQLSELHASPPCLLLYNQNNTTCHSNKSYLEKLGESSSCTYYCDVDETCLYFCNDNSQKSQAMSCMESPCFNWHKQKTQGSAFSLQSYGKTLVYSSILFIFLTQMLINPPDYYYFISLLIFHFIYCNTICTSL